MAGKTKSKSNSKKNTKKNATFTKKTNKSNRKKSTVNTKNSKTVKKVTTTKKNNNSKNVTKTVNKKTPVLTNSKVEKKDFKTSILEELSSLKKIVLNKKKVLLKKFNDSPKYIKYLGLVCILCFSLLLLEGILLISHRIVYDINVVYHDSYTDVISDDGSVITVGNSDFKSNNSNKYTKDNSHGKIIKYDLNGNIIFEKIYEKGIATTFNSVISIDDGYIVVGTGIFSEEEKKNEGKEAFILKYDKDGELIWEKFYQVLTDTSFNAVKETSDGYIVVGQSIYANNELGNHTTGGGIIVKYDKDGNILWHNNHGGTKSGSFNDLVVTRDNSIYVVGKDGADYANLVKFNADGTYQWHKNYGYTDSFGFGGIAYLNNYLYVVGSKKILPAGTTDEDDRSTSNTDAILIKYDLDGNIVFEKSFGGSSFERYNSIILYQNNFYVVGHICSHDAGLKVTSDEKNEMSGLIVRYDINGNILKKEVLGGSNNDNLTAITTDGISFYAVGYSNSDNGNITTHKSNGKDYFGELIKLNKRFKLIFSK